MHGLIEDYAISRGITELWGVVNPDNLRALAAKWRITDDAIARGLNWLSMLQNDDGGK